MLAHVEQDISDRIADLPRGLEYPQVIAPSQDAPRPAEDPVRRAGQPCCNSLHPAPQGVLRSRFDDPTEFIEVPSATQPLERGSYNSFQVVAHPTIAGASLVVYRQQAVVPLKGKMTKALRTDDKSGRNSFWKDADRHAHRIHWALDAVLTEPPGAGRRAMYIANYQRWFQTVPYWAR